LKFLPLGDTHLGGDDQLIAEDIITNFKKTEGVDLYQKNKHYNELKLLKKQIELWLSVYLY
jgi:molecular chaperone DnaK (HSP70)